MVLAPGHVLGTDEFRSLAEIQSRVHGLPELTFGMTRSVTRRIAD